MRDAVPHAILLCADFQQWSCHWRLTGLLPLAIKFSCLVFGVVHITSRISRVALFSTLHVCHPYIVGPY